MNKIYLLAGAVASSFALNAQVLSPNQSFEEAKGLTNVELQAKALGTVLWSSDFSTASDWDSADGANHTSGDWEIQTTLPASLSALATSTGTYDFASIWASESGGEFAIVNSDAAGGGQVQEAYFETGDLTIATDIVAAGGTVNDALSIRWIQMYRRFQESHNIEVSTDGGVTWVSYLVNDVPVNTNSKSPGVDPDVQTEFLTVPAASAWTDQTRFRVYYQGTWDWFWVIDDFSVSTLPDFDLANSATYWGVNGLSFTDGSFKPFQYYRIPNAQIQEHSFSANVFNNGGQDLTNATLTVDVNAGAVTATSNVVASLTPGAADSVFATFTPMADMTYDIQVSVDSDEAEDVPANNAFEVIPTIITGGDIYSRDQGAQTNAGGSDDGNGNFGFEAGNYFEISSAATLHALDIGIDAEPNNEGVEIYAILYNLDASGNFVAVAVSDFKIINSVDLGEIMTIYFDTPFDLTAGELYFAAVGTTGDFVYQTSGIAPDNTSLIYYPTMTDPITGSNFYTSNTPVVRMNFKAPSVGLDELAANLSLEVYPNPASNNVNASFSLENASNVEVSISDLSGKVVYTNNLGNVAAGTHKVNVPTSELSNGVYFYNVAVNNTIATEKLVIKK